MILNNHQYIHAFLRHIPYLRIYLESRDSDTAWRPLSKRCFQVRPPIVQGLYGYMRKKLVQKKDPWDPVLCHSVVHSSQPCQQGPWRFVRFAGADFTRDYIAIDLLVLLVFAMKF